MGLTRKTSLRWLLPVVLLAALVGCTTPQPSSPNSTAAPAGNGVTASGAASSIPTPEPASGLSLSRPAQAPPPHAVTPAARIQSNSPLPKGGWADLPEAPDRDLYRLAAQLSPGGLQEIPRVVNPEPVSYTQGRIDTFWLIDLRDLKVYQRPFELRLVSPKAYWYVEEGQNIQQSDIERAAAVFEEEIYPRVTAVFGREWSPGVDNDPHLNILHARLRGVGGYYSSSDEYPQSVYRYSNQRETVYINTSSLQVGSLSYLAVLAHELQHATHWNNDPTEDTWINEGLSELASEVAGYRPDSIGQFLRSPTVSLVHWPLEPARVSANYGAAYLFLHYLSEHYGTRADLHLLAAEQEDSIRGIDAYLRKLGYGVTFHDVFRDWMVANVLDEPKSTLPEGRTQPPLYPSSEKRRVTEGVYGYKDLAVRVRVSRLLDSFGQVTSAIPQYAAEYTEIKVPSQGPLRLRFRGQTENSLIPVDVGERGCWWSNSGDSINSTLTRAIDLTGLTRATLSYQVWYQVEESWDYGYIEISVDGGRTWAILETPHTSPENPIGNGFGPGYTGDSGGWITETIDLTAYAGRPVLLRFQYVTDDAINGTGLCLRRISLSPPPPGAGSGDTEGVLLDRGWQAEGFILTNNRVQQEYVVQVIQKGQDNQVMTVTLDEVNSGEIVIPDPQGLDRLIVAVAALAPKTLQPVSYTLTVEPAG